MTALSQRSFFTVIGMVAVFVLFTQSVFAASLTDRLAGFILLQVESKGEAWYVEPVAKERWYLGRPADAFAVMRRHGLGISNANLARIPRAGSADRADAKFAQRFAGRILLAVEAKGEAWYVYPKDERRYFLGRPDDAFALMRQLGLGVTDTNLVLVPLAAGSAAAVSAPPPLTVVEEIPPQAPVVTAPMTAPSPSVSPVPSSSPAFRADMLALLNGERQKMAATSLVLNDAMNAAAQRLTDDMVHRGYFALKTPEGLGAKEVLKEAGYEPRAVGILIAGGPRDAAVAFGLWTGGESSEGLIVKADYEELGVGMTPGANEENIWVVLFASSQARYEAQIMAPLADMVAMRQAMLARVNAERAQQGLPALVINALLNESAQKKSEDMFTKDYFEHESPDGVTPQQLIASTGYPARMFAENLAKDPKTVDEVMTGWMASPGHRANILLDGITEAGFGLHFGRNASGFTLYWTQHFGKQ